MELKGKTALVTGGAHRVGKSIALALAAQGMNLVINYNQSSKAAEETVQEIQSLGVGALAVQANVAEVEQVFKMEEKANKTFGGVDVLVNSASVFEATPFPTTDFSAWQKVTRIAIDGSFYCVNAVAPGMLTRGEGAILFIVDLSAWEPWPNFAAHSVAKAGVMALMRQTALELAPTVRVNAIAPGPVLPPPDFTPAMIESTGKNTLLNRWGRPEDVADAVVFLAKADYITADVLFVDGGERYGHRKNYMEQE
jgi:3-oxoacyl-[acyl-carrier protein] reductase/pteridine reductase